MISQKICKKKLIFKHKNDIILPSMTFEFIGHLMTNMSLLNISNHRKIYQNQVSKKEVFQENFKNK